MQHGLTAVDHDGPGHERAALRLGGTKRLEFILNARPWLKPDLKFTTHSPRNGRGALDELSPATHAFGSILQPESALSDWRPRCGPYIQVGWSGDDDIVAEVSSNRVLDPKFRIRKSDRRFLRDLGWNRSDESHLNYWIHVDSVYADQVADMLVMALRGGLQGGPSSVPQRPFPRGG